MAERQANAVWEGDLLHGSGDVSGGSGALRDLPVTWVARTERPDGKTSPEELIAAAHAACYAMALSHTLAQQGHAPRRLEVSATVTFEPADGGFKIGSSTLNVTGDVPGLDQSQFEEAAREGERGCPVSNALRNNVDIRLNARLASS
jgi:osmotically inducible protein OsmC